jgi:starch phosphorylase
MKLQERVRGNPSSSPKHGDKQAETPAGENRSGTSAEEIAFSFRNEITHSVSRPIESSSPIDKFHALPFAVV